MTMADQSISSSIFSRCASIDFGSICPAPGEKEFYGRLNEAVVELVRSLPRSMQAGAMLFVMGYAGLRLGDTLDFFRNYYPPIWSCLFWLAKEGDDNYVPPELAAQGVRAHAMAMMLHSLDDHLADGEVPVSHLALLLRSQAWRLLHESLAPLAAAVPAGGDTAAELLDDYYSGITASTQPGSLDDYCALFEKQMATGLIVPLLLARAAGGQSLLRNGLEEGVRASLVRFGTAWRLLDDVRDLKDDMAAGRRTGVYWALPVEDRRIWDFRGSEPVKIPSEAITIAKNPDLKALDPSNIDPAPITIGQNSETGGSEPVKKRLETLSAMIQEKGTIDIIIGRIVRELAQAAAHAEKAYLPGLAEEYRTLAAPLNTRR
jgi:hypothetical protein